MRALTRIGRNKWFKRLGRGTFIVGGAATFASHYYGDGEYALEAVGNTAVEVGLATFLAGIGARGGLAAGLACGPGAWACVPAFALVGGGAGSFGGGWAGSKATDALESRWHPAAGKIQNWF
jgi:hypothetical protein